MVWEADKAQKPVLAPTNALNTAGNHVATSLSIEMSQEHNRRLREAKARDERERERQTAELERKVRGKIFTHGMQ